MPQITPLEVFNIKKDGASIALNIARLWQSERFQIYTSALTPLSTSDLRALLPGPVEENVVIGTFTCEALGIAGRPEETFFIDRIKLEAHFQGLGLYFCFQDDAFPIREAKNHPGGDKAEETIWVVHKPVHCTQGNSDMLCLFTVGCEKGCKPFLGAVGLSDSESLSVGLGACKLQPKRVLALRMTKPPF